MPASLSRLSARLRFVLAVLLSVSAISAVSMPAHAADATHSVDTFPIDPSQGGATGILMSGTTIWGSQNAAAGRSFVYDAATQTRGTSVSMPWGRDIVLVGDYVAVAASAGVQIFDKQTLAIVATIPVASADGIVYANGSLYVSAIGTPSRISQYDVSALPTVTLTKTINPLFKPGRLFYDGSQIWVMGYAENAVTVFDANLNQVAIKLDGNRPNGATVQGNKVYVAYVTDNTLIAYNKSTLAKSFEVSIGAGTYDLYSDSKYLWASSSTTDTVYQLNLDNGTQINTYAVGDQPYSITGNGTEVWTANPAGVSLSRLRPAPVPDAAKSSLSMSAKELASDGAATSTATVTVKDQYGTVMAGQSVCLTLDSGTGTLSSGPWTTDADGKVTATLTAPSAIGDGTVKAVLGTCESPGDSIGSEKVTYVNPPDATKSTIAADKTSIPADGTATSTVTVTVNNANGGPVANSAVCLTLTGGGTLAAGPWTTDADGKVTATVTADTTVGSGTVSATLGTCDAPGAKIGEVKITYAKYPKPTITAAKKTLTADGKATTTVKVHVVDHYGENVVGQSVCLVHSGDGSMGAGPWVTDANGDVTVTVTAAADEGASDISAGLGDCGLDGAIAGEQIGSVTISYRAEPTTDGTSGSGGAGGLGKGGSGGLPRTGGNPWMPLAVAALLLCAGLALRRSRLQL